MIGRLPTEGEPIAPLRSARRSLVGASFLIAQPLLLNVLSLPVTAYIIASLGPRDYGQWSIALTLIAMTGVITNLGLRSFFIRRVAREPQVAPEAFAEQLGLRTALALVAGAVSLAICVALGYPTIVLQCAAILACGAIFSAAAAVVSDLLAATERLPALATVNMIAGLLLTAGSIAAVWLGTGLLGLAVSYLLGPLVAGVLSLLLVHRRYFSVRVTYSPQRFLALLNDAKVLGLQLFVMNLGNNAENLLVPKIVGITAYGNFAAGTLLPRRLEVVPDGLNTAFYPVLARGYRESRQQAAATVRKHMLFMCGACVPVAIGLFVLANPIALMLFPNQPETFRIVIRITAWWVPLIGLAYASGYALNAAGREKDEAKIAIIGTAVSLVLSVVLITRFGLIGACVAMVAKAAIGLTFRLPYLVNTLKHDRTVENPDTPALEQRV